MESFTKEEMVSFGEYLLSKERTEKIIDHPDASKMAPVEERLQMVYDSDFDQWKVWLTKKSLNKNLDS